MEFLEIVSDFESQISEEFKYELLEMHFVPYSFGAGFVAYRINGRTVKIIFDGKDKLIESKISNWHEKYPPKSLDTFFIGSVNDFIDKGIMGVRNELKIKSK
jgi:hypothetical protein